MKTAIRFDTTSDDFERIAERLRLAIAEADRLVEVLGTCPDVAPVEDRLDALEREIEEAHAALEGHVRVTHRVPMNDIKRPEKKPERSAA